MRPIYNRKTSPKVIGGHVQRKNNHVKTARLGYVLDCVSPCAGLNILSARRMFMNYGQPILNYLVILGLKN